MTCRTAVELVCRSLDDPLSSGERVGVAVHTLFCGPCRRFRRQARRLDGCCREAFADPSGRAELPPAARERIAAALDRAAGEP